MFRTSVSLDEFMRIALDPANADRRLQRIDGEIVEYLSSNHASQIAATLICEVGIFIRQHKLGYVTGADCGYTISGEQYIADGAFVSYEREPKNLSEYYPDAAPNLVIEVLSPRIMGSPDEREKLARKVANYLAAGCELWLVDAVEEKLERCIPNQAVRTYRNGDILEGVGVLEGFRLEIRSIWPE
jgi:Uma2 family endonuclease